MWEQPSLHFYHSYMCVDRSARCESTAAVCTQHAFHPIFPCSPHVPADFFQPDVFSSVDVAAVWLPVSVSRVGWGRQWTPRSSFWNLFSVKEVIEVFALLTSEICLCVFNMWNKVVEYWVHLPVNWNQKVWSFYNTVNSQTKLCSEWKNEYMEFYTAS